MLLVDQSFMETGRKNIKFQSVLNFPFQHFSQNLLYFQMNKM